MGRTLYITDLDGTLLGADKQVSARSAGIINRLTQRGMLFSYATARSVHTASVITGNIDFRCPIIAHNGTFIMDNKSFAMLHGNFFTEAEAARIINELDRLEFSHIVYSIMDGRERFSYLEAGVSPQLRKFLDIRMDDVRRRQVSDRAELYRGEIYYFNCIDAPEKAWELYGLLKDEFNCVCAPEVYFKDIWLEIMPKSASKASAALQLKNMLCADRLVVFGDGVNDLPMFSVADECYAVGNAVDEVKKAATAVIGDNTSDGVAIWLEENFKG